MLVETREEARRFFLHVYRKVEAGEPLSPMEALVARVIDIHPEYRPLLTAGESVLEQDFGRSEPAHNPFLHMGLHVALSEQLAADRPSGVRAIHAALSAGILPQELHELEHRMIECLAEVLFRAQSNGRMPDEAAYLCALRGLR